MRLISLEPMRLGVKLMIDNLCIHSTLGVNVRQVTKILKSTKFMIKPVFGCVKCWLKHVAAGALWCINMASLCKRASCRSAYHYEYIYVPKHLIINANAGFVDILTSCIINCAYNVRIAINQDLFLKAATEVVSQITDQRLVFFNNTNFALGSGVVVDAKSRLSIRGIYIVCDIYCGRTQMSIYHLLIFYVDFWIWKINYCRICICKLVSI